MENWTLEFKGGGAWIAGYLFVPSDWDTWRQEAHLIHAAPDLLAACEEAARILGNMGYTSEEGGPDECYHQLLAAAAKAKGE